VHEHPSGHPSTSQNKVFIDKAAVIIQENIAQLMNLLTCLVIIIGSAHASLCADMGKK
jgi:DNA repair protein RadC